MGSWCPVPLQTRSCNTYVMLCQTQHVSCVWRSACLPWAMLSPVTTMWLLCILIWTEWVTLFSQLLCVTVCPLHCVSASLCVAVSFCVSLSVCVSFCVSAAVCHCQLMCVTVEGLHEFVRKTVTVRVHTHMSTIVCVKAYRSVKCR